MGDRVDPDLEIRRLAAMSDRVRDLRRKLKKVKESVVAQRAGVKDDGEETKPAEADTRQSGSQRRW